MYWIEICTNGSYIHAGKEHFISLEGIQSLESYETVRSDREWARIILPFRFDTNLGTFLWEVEIIEYLQLGVASYIGQSLIVFPDQVILKDEVTFCLQDGWPP